ncbi:hypothetical protein A2U01_0115351, partial [Trifolium medium]|nr:hypothetical protein [Trifolium medium]
VGAMERKRWREIDGEEVMERESDGDGWRESDGESDGERLMERWV